MPYGREQTHEAWPQMNTQLITILRYVAHSKLAFVITLIGLLLLFTVSALESASVFSEISSSHLKSITSSLDFHHDYSRTC